MEKKSNLEQAAEQYAKKQYEEMDGVIEKLKEKWITEFGDMKKELDGIGIYFITGFVSDALQSTCRNNSRNNLT